MISNILKSLSKESPDGYLLSRSELPSELLEWMSSSNSSMEDDEIPSSTTDSASPIYVPTFRAEVNEFDSESINLDTLIPQIRPQQYNAFMALYTTFKDNSKNTVPPSALYVDLPLRNEFGYLWVRCKISIESNVVETWIIDKKKPWLGQPIFPRLLVNNELILLSDDFRKETYLAFLKNNNLKRCPLHKMPRLMLRVAYTAPNYTYAQISEYTKKGKTLDKESYSLTYEAVKKNFKSLGTIGRNLFGVQFYPIKHLGEYWKEMGFDITTIPELE